MSTYFAKTTECLAKQAHGEVCVELLDLAFPIRLYQFGADAFTVQYGLQIKYGLSYSQAAKEFGLAVMHALNCDGKMTTKEDRQ